MCEIRPVALIAPVFGVPFPELVHRFEMPLGVLTVCCGDDMISMRPHERIATNIENIHSIRERSEFSLNCIDVLKVALLQREWKTEVFWQ